MVRAIVFVSAVLAMVAYVSAAPSAPVIGVGIGHVGTGDVNAQKVVNDVVDADNLKIKDVAKKIGVLSHIH